MGNAEPIKCGILHFCDYGSVINMLDLVKQKTDHW